MAGPGAERTCGKSQQSVSRRALAVSYNLERVLGSTEVAEERENNTSVVVVEKVVVVLDCSADSVDVVNSVEQHVDRVLDGVRRERKLRMCERLLELCKRERER